MAFVILFTVNTVKAEEVADYQNAENEYLQAVISLATYSDRIAICSLCLNEQGWDIVEFQENMKMLMPELFWLKKHDLINGKELYILAVPGTENFKDAGIDLTFDKVYFAGNTPEDLLKMPTKECQQ